MRAGGPLSSPNWSLRLSPSSGVPGLRQLLIEVKYEIWWLTREECLDEASLTLHNSTKSLSPEQRHLDVQACSLTALRQEFQGCLVCFADSTSGFVTNVASEKNFPPFVTTYSAALRRSNGSLVGSPAEVRACEMSLSDP